MAGSVNAALGTEGAPVIIEWSKGKTLMRPPDWGGVIAKLERRLTEREQMILSDGLDALAKKGTITAEQAMDRIASFADDAANNGRYSFGSPRMMKVFTAFETGQVATADGSLLWSALTLLSLILDLSFDDTATLFREKKVEVLSKMKLLMTEGMPDPKDAGASPPNSGPAAP